MFCLLSHLSHSVEYKLTATSLIISGKGEITKEGISSKGSVSQVIKVIIEEGPYKIAKYAFSQCKQLEEINIPKSITTMGQPFNGCGKLVKIVVDSGNNDYCNDENFILYTKDKHNLIKAPSVKNLNIPEDVVNIVEYAFTSNLFNYGNVVLPASLTTLNSLSFYASVFDSLSFKSNSQLTYLMGFNWASITTLRIPTSVTVIKKKTFESATINNIVFEEVSCLETIEESSFVDFRGSSISLPDSVKTIGSYAFKESKLVTIKIGASCSDINITAFTGCKYINQIIISENNTYYSSNKGILMDTDKTQIIFIPESFETITILSTVTTISKTALQSSYKLNKIVFEGENEKWSQQNGVLYSKDFTKVIAVCGGVKNVNAHADVTTVDEYAAFGCINLKQFSFTSSSIKTIGTASFSGSGLTSFELPNTVTTINENAFSKMQSLKTFTMQKDSPLSIIPQDCFSGSALTSFTFGANIETISSQSFYSCADLKEIHFPQDSIISSIGRLAFGYCSLVSVTFPKSITTIGDRCFESEGELETVIFDKNSELTEIKEYSFRGCISLLSVVLPDKCTTLGNEVFSGCISLLSIEHKLTAIGNSAFENCVSLQNFTFSLDQTSSINPGIFKNCYNIKYFYVEEGNTEIVSSNGIIYSKNLSILYLFPPGQEMAKIPVSTTQFADNAFAYSPKLKFVAFYSGSNLETIGATAFYECKHLVTVQFPSKLRVIKAECFSGCTSLKSVFFPQTLEKIESGAFLGCSKLRSVKYCGTINVTGENVFDPSIVISVTDLYPTDVFCTNSISKRLTFDCEFKNEFLPTCRVYHNAGISLSPLLYILLINLA